MKRHKDMDIEKSIKRNGIEAEKEIEAGREIISEKGQREKRRERTEQREKERNRGKCEKGIKRGSESIRESAAQRKIAIQRAG